MELNVSHIAGYLSHKIQIARFDSKDNFKRVEKYRFNKTGIGDIIRYRNLKLILRPLSDITKVIIHKGHLIKPIDEIFKIMTGLDPNEEFGYWGKFSHAFGESYYFHTKANSPMSSISTNPLEMPYMVVRKLYEWGFDVDNLIENNLAFDINKLK